MLATPTFQSIVFDDLPRPDYADVALMPWLGPKEPDPTVLARRVFALSGLPVWVKALLAARQVLVRLIGVPPAPPNVFAVRAVAGPEALIAADDVHLDFRAGVAVEDGRLRVTTAVRLKGWRGRLYFLPVRVLHPMIVRSMMRSAVRRTRVGAVG